MEIRLRGKRGQNTAEYLVMLILIAVGSIGVFTAFGATLKKHINHAVIAFTGGDTTTIKTDSFDKEREHGGNAATDAHGMNLDGKQAARFGGASGTTPNP